MTARRILIGAINPNAKPYVVEDHYPAPDPYAEPLARMRLEADPDHQLGVMHRRATQAGGRTRGKDQQDKAATFDKRLLDTITRWQASDERVTVRKLAKLFKVNARTITRSLTRTGRTLPKF